MKTLEAEKLVNQKKLTGKVALVTGGSRGIGKGIALKLAEQGAIVALTYAKSADAAEQLVKEVEALGTTAFAYKADVYSEDDVAKLTEQLKKTVGRVDILVNNAGVFDGAPVEQVTLGHYDKLFGVNVRGLIASTIATLPLLNDGGRIINISSVAATKTMSGFGVYSATKAAVNTLTRIWAQDLGARKITVNAVAPGTTQSDMYDQAMTPEMKEWAISKTALGRVGQPADIANVVAFLASDDGGWVTGQVIETDGGISI